MEPICAIKDLYKTLYQFERRFSQQNGLTINEAMVLCCLKDGEARTAGALSEFVGLSNSRVSHIVNTMETNGLILRLLNPADKRQMLFTLTAQGRERIAALHDGAAELDALFAQLRACLR